MIMESAKNVRWIIPFKKFGMVRVKIWKVCNTRNNYTDSIWFHIKQQIMKELSMVIVCLYIWYNLRDTIYHYIATNKVLLNKKYYS